MDYYQQTIRIKGTLTTTEAHRVADTSPPPKYPPINNLNKKS